MKFFLILTIQLMLSVTQLMGQKALYLRPSLGMQFPFCYLSNRSAPEDTFDANTFNFGLDIGLTFQFDFNPKNSLILGYNSAGLGYSFSFGSPEYKFERRFSSTSKLHIFPLGYQRYIATAKWFKIKRRSELIKDIKSLKSQSDDILYLVLFRVRLLTGVSYSYLKPMTDDNTTSTDCFGDCIIENQVLQRNNLSIFGGVNLQFFNFKKNSFQLSFIYSQGLIDQQQAVVDYRLESPSFNHSAILMSRGSYFTIQISYPIKIKSFSNYE